MNSTLFFPTALSQGAITKITAKLIIFPFIPNFCFQILQLAHRQLGSCRCSADGAPTANIGNGNGKYKHRLKHFGKF